MFAKSLEKHILTKDLESFGVMNDHDERDHDERDHDERDHDERDSKTKSPPRGNSQYYIK